MKFMTTKHISRTEEKTLKKSIKKLKQVYMQRGFKIINILMDGKLTCIRGNLAGLKINLNVFSNNEHIGDIERLK